MSARLFVAVIGLAGCSSDTDPTETDTDGDGLSDRDELLNGADPRVPDTDRDGYTDRDEVFEGTDPADASSVITQGGWPYSSEKEDLPGGTFDGLAEVDKRFARVELSDQHGDLVDLFDFYNAEKPVVIDVSAQWCRPRQKLATWIGGGGDSEGLGSLWSAGPDAVARGEVYWITVLGEDLDHLGATGSTAREWAADLPTEQIPVLAEGSTPRSTTWASRGGPPSSCSIPTSRSRC